MIGKSFFLSYVLVERLLRGLPTVYLTPTGELFIFYKKGCIFYSKRDVEDVDLDHIWEQHPDAWWALLDNPDPPSVLRYRSGKRDWVFVHAASPGSLKDTKWCKNMACAVQYIDVWSVEELYSVG